MNELEIRLRFIMGNVYSVGAALSVVLSWSSWHSLGWAAFHGFCGWVYVIYWWIQYS